jgi:F-type H+-transporting ATPase subunit alpha
MMKQPQYSPMSVAEQALMLFVVDRGHLDDVAIDKVVDFEAALLSYARSEHGELLGKINQNPVLNDEIEQSLTKVAESFKANHAW